jgi:hypothetical protein
MKPINALIRTPDVDSLTQASERAPLSLLAAAALCARNVLIVEHRDVFDCPTDQGDHEDTPLTISLVALQVADHIDELLKSLRLYDASLRDHLRARRFHGLPF